MMMNMYNLDFVIAFKLVVYQTLDQKKLILVIKFQHYVIKILKFYQDVVFLYYLYPNNNFIIYSYPILFSIQFLSGCINRRDNLMMKCLFKIIIIIANQFKVILTIAIKIININWNY